MDLGALWDPLKPFWDNFQIVMVGNAIHQQSIPTIAQKHFNVEVHAAGWLGVNKIRTTEYQE